MTTPTPTFMDERFQEKILGGLFKIPGFAAVASQHLRPSYFDGVIAKNVAKLAVGHYKDFGCCMSKTAFIREVSAKFKSRSDILAYAAYFGKVAGEKVVVSDSDYVLSDMVNWIKVQRWKLFAEELATKHFETSKPDFDKIEKQAAGIINVNAVADSPGYDYFNSDNIKNRAAKRKADEIESVGISTGITELDRKLYGKGWMPKELYLVLGPPKRGKSMALLYFANAAALLGKNVMHFTCEVSTEICSARLDALNSDIPFYSLPKYSDNVAREVEKKMPGKGQTKIFEYPTGQLTAFQIKEKADELINKGFIPDICFVDYLDLMRPQKKTADIYTDQGEIAVELRGVATQLSIPMVSASQINRSGAKKELTGGDDVSGGYGKIATADQIITLSGTEEDLRTGKLKVHMSESRNNATALLNIETEFEKGKFFKRFISGS